MEITNINRNLTCLADNMVYPADSSETGINLNEIVVGSTGCGKTMSLCIPRLLHTYDSSIVVPIAKSSIMNKFSKLFEERGYEVELIDFVNPEKSTVGYDPFDYIKSDEDVIHLVKNMLEGGKEFRGGNYDPFWDESAESMVGSIFQLNRENEKSGGKKATLVDSVELFRNLNAKYTGSYPRTRLDAAFENLEKQKPGNQACMLWRTYSTAPVKTASTIHSCANNAMDKFMSENIKKFVSKERKIDFASLGEKKTILFIKTSPMNTALYNFINIMYSDMFRCLFETAESSEDGRLEIPVHIICDDFACGSRIVNFENYISIFRAAGISVSLLLQSESQLFAMYGESGGKTIINNCDTYVYMGGMDYDTCFNISRKINKPLEQVIGLPKEQVIVFRRGMQPRFAKRYRTLEDPEYIRAMQLA